MKPIKLTKCKSMSELEKRMNGTYTKAGIKILLGMYFLYKGIDAYAFAERDRMTIALNKHFLSKND